MNIVGASDIIHSVVSILFMYISFIAWQQPQVTMIYGCHGYCLSNMHLLIEQGTFMGISGKLERFPGSCLVHVVTASSDPVN